MSAGSGEDLSVLNDSGLRGCRRGIRIRSVCLLMGPQTPEPRALTMPQRGEGLQNAGGARRLGPNTASIISQRHNQKRDGAGIPARS